MCYSPSTRVACIFSLLQTCSYLLMMGALTAHTELEMDHTHVFEMYLLLETSSVTYLLLIGPKIGSFARYLSAMALALCFSCWYVLLFALEPFSRSAVSLNAVAALGLFLMIRHGSPAALKRHRTLFLVVSTVLFLGLVLRDWKIACCLVVSYGHIVALFVLSLTQLDAVADSCYSFRQDEYLAHAVLRIYCAPALLFLAVGLKVFSTMLGWVCSCMVRKDEMESPLLIPSHACYPSSIVVPGLP